MISLRLYFVLLWILLTMTVVRAEILRDTINFAFKTTKMSTPRKNVLTAEFRRHVGGLPRILRGAKLKLTIQRYRWNRISGNVILTSPSIGEGRGWLTMVKFWGGYSGVLQAEFTRPLISVRLYLRGAPGQGFIGVGRAQHKFSRPAGVRMVRSGLTVAQGVEALQQALKANPNGPRLIATIDHSLSAKRVGLQLAPNTVVVFGRPQIGAPLWRQRAEIGIELPMELQIAESPLGKVYVSYNAAGYLARRFNIKIGRIPLFRFARIAAGRAKIPEEPRNFDVSRASLLQGIVSSSRTGTTAAAAYARLVTALTKARPVGIAYKIEHDKSAIRAGISVASENKVVVFGNPALGTRLMQRAFTAGLDLPAKMGVWNLRTGSDKTFVGYVSIDWIVRRHDVAEKQPILSGALANFQKVALGM